MSTAKPSTPQGARSVLRLDRRKETYHFISYPLSADPSIPPDEIELSWLDFPDDAWPPDEWVVGADVDTLFWPSGVFGEESCPPRVNSRSPLAPRPSQLRDGGAT